MIKVYRKTGTIKAEQFDPENGVIPEGVFDKEFEHTTSGMISAMVNELQTGKPAHNWHIKTLEGDLKVNPGDWIATGVNGERWPIADDVFKKTYAELSSIPSYVAEYIDATKNNQTRLNDPNIAEAIVDVVEYGGGSAELASWIEWNGDAFARAWLDGYQVEEEK